MPIQHKRRTVVRVHWSVEHERWCAMVDQNVIYTHKTKDAMLTVLRSMMNNILAAGFLGQLVWHEKDGTIGFESTCGEDPDPRKAGKGAKG